MSKPAHELPITPASAPESRPVQVTIPPVKNIATAPFIYFDGVPTFGVQNGLVEIELTSRADDTARSFFGAAVSSSAAGDRDMAPCRPSV